MIYQHRDIQHCVASVQEEESRVIQGLAWATVGEMETKVAQLQHQITEKGPAKIAKLESLLGPARENVAAMTKQCETQVSLSPLVCSQSMS